MANSKKRKLLFLLFSDDACRQNHALMYGIDLYQKGHEVKILIEGQATRVLNEITDPDSHTGELLRQAHKIGIVAGTCARASSGCSSNDPARNVAEIARAHGIDLLSDMDGHAGIESFVHDGYEIVAL
jgi:hypothetical protein